MKQSSLAQAVKSLFVSTTLFGAVITIACTVLTWSLASGQQADQAPRNNAGLVQRVADLEKSIELLCDQLDDLGQRRTTVVRQQSLTIELAKVRMQHDLTQTIPTELTIPEGACEVCCWLVPKSDLYRLTLVNELWAAATNNQVEVHVEVVEGVPTNDGGKPMGIDVFVAYQTALDND